METRGMVARFLIGEERWDLSDDTHVLHARYGCSLSQSCSTWRSLLGPSMRKLFLFSWWRSGNAMDICNYLMGDIFHPSLSRASCAAMALATRPLSWTCTAWSHFMKLQMEALRRRYNSWLIATRSPMSDSWDSD